MALTPSTTLLAALLVCLAGGAARADVPTPAEPPAPPAPPIPSGLVPPRPLGSIDVPYPPDAPPVTEPVVVTAKLLIDASGHVAKVELVSAGTAAAGDAVLRAAAAFAFTPATLDGQAVAVEIAFTHTFLPPERAPDPAAPEPLPSALRGRLRERGTREPVAGASVSVVIDGATYEARSDAAGNFRVPTPAGAARVLVRATGYHDFLQKEALAAGEELVVGYFIDADHYDPYEIVIHGGTKREEVTRVTLRGHEAKQVAGTLGDPFRVIQTLPGVGSMISLLPFPIVRGASPASTGFLIDGVRVPLLYHLMAGPSVVNPNFIDEVAFYPGGFPAPLGNYTAGIVDGHTHRGAKDERVVDIDLNLTQAGAFVRVPILGTSLSVAGRYGYPGLLLSAISDGEVSLSYWDYQLRFDAGTPRQGLTIFAYGAGDTLKQRESVMKETATPEGGDSIDPSFEDPPKEMVTLADMMFHRLDLRYLQATGPVDGIYRLVLGYDETLAGTDATFRTFGIETLNRWKMQASGCLELAAGLDLGYRDTRAIHGVATDDSPFDVDLTDVKPGPHHVSGAAFAEGLWHPIPALLVRPGLRVDGRWDGETSAFTLDPRLIVRYRVLDSVGLDDASEASADDAVWLKASVGLYHQPPRLPAPLPGLDELPLRYGELAAWQSSLGIELPFAREWQLDAEAYYNALDPVVFDISVNAEPSSVDGSPNSNGTSNDSGSNLLDRFVRKQSGRAMGLELMLRKRDTGRGLHGWLSYTLSRSERMRDGAWVPFDFDRTHLLNLVLGWTLPRNWEFSVRVQYESGKPKTTAVGYNAGRDDGYVRVDVRVDKHAVWNDWVLDFYVDLTNAALLPEEIAPGNILRYVLPTFGVRGRL